MSKSNMTCDNCNEIIKADEFACECKCIDCGPCEAKCKPKLEKE
tara:strand:+ start:206 stop:337 length:132 start_codon:yes stop_codon:yes gene_type:complete